MTLCQLGATDNLKLEATVISSSCCRTVRAGRAVLAGAEVDGATVAEVAAGHPTLRLRRLPVGCVKKLTALVAALSGADVDEFPLRELRKMCRVMMHGGGGQPRTPKDRRTAVGDGVKMVLETAWDVDSNLFSFFFFFGAGESVSDGWRLPQDRDCGVAFQPLKSPM